MAWTEPKPAVVFASENVTLRIYLKSAAREARRPKFEYRLYQTAEGATIPLGERKKWKEIAIAPGQTVIETMKFSFNQIRQATPFTLKIYEEGHIEEVGSLSVLVQPENALARAPIKCRTPLPSGGRLLQALR